MRFVLKLLIVMIGEDVLLNLLRMIWNVGYVSVKMVIWVKNVRKRIILCKLDDSY